MEDEEAILVFDNVDNVAVAASFLLLIIASISLLMLAVSVSASMSITGFPLLPVAVVAATFTDTAVGSLPKRIDTSVPCDIIIDDSFVEVAVEAVEEEVEQV